MASQQQGRAKGKRVTKRRDVREAAYFALHGTNLARAIAAGALHPGLIDGSGDTGLMPTNDVGIGDALQTARGGREYGVVALVEVARCKLPAAAEGEEVGGVWPANYLPLGLVDRVIFRSADERDEFLARASGYGDVPSDIFDYQVEPDLFAPTSSRSLLDERQSCKGNISLETGVVKARSIDKLAGAASACLSAIRLHAEQKHLPVAFESACSDCSSGVLPGRFVRALALRLDPTDEGEASANLLAGAASSLEAVAPGDGFDGESFLLSFIERFESGSDEERIARKFGERASAVLSGQLEVAADAFADSPGKVILRALLLFLLNPDTTRLQSIGRRLENIGPSVKVVALALAGSLSGFSALPRSLKAVSRDAYLAVPLLARSLIAGDFGGFVRSRIWKHDASSEFRLCIEEFPILVQKGAPPHGFTELISVLMNKGLSPVVDNTSGLLGWKDSRFKAADFGARPSLTPTFPVRRSVELFAVLNVPRTKRELMSSVGAINGNAKISGIFGACIAHGKKHAVEISVICDLLELPIIDQASLALIGQLERLTSVTGSLIVPD